MTPYMPDPKGIFEAVASDLEDVGFTIVPHTATWTPDYLDAEYAGEYEMWLLGWSCDVATPSSFLFQQFRYVDGEPLAEFSYPNDQLEETMQQARAAPTAEEAQALWEEGQRLIGEGLPTIPMVHAKEAAAAQAYVRDFVGSPVGPDHLSRVWLDN